MQTDKICLKNFGKLLTLRLNLSKTNVFVPRVPQIGNGIFAVHAKASAEHFQWGANKNRASINSFVLDVLYVGRLLNSGLFFVYFYF